MRSPRAGRRALSRVAHGGWSCRATQTGVLEEVFNAFAQGGCLDQGACPNGGAAT